MTSAASDRSAVWLGWLVCLVVLGTCGRVTHAHKMRTLYLEITEVARGKAWLFRKATTDDRSITLHFAPGCRVKRTLISAVPPTSTYQLQCPFPLAGTRLRVAGLGPVIDEAVVRFRAFPATTPIATKLLFANDDTWRLPHKRSRWRVLVGYTGLGLTHILGGADHLLFVLALLLLVFRRRAMLLTITAFTLSHSLTLAATTLGWIRISAPAAEACIAWSLVLTAWDVTRRERLANPDGQGPWLGLVFGLVHGFGFAGSLQGIGLPAEAIPISLLGFNIGVELGQLLLVIPGFALLSWMRQHHEALSGYLQWLMAYGIGTVGAFWFWSRLALLV